MNISEFRYDSSNGRSSVRAKQWLPDGEIKAVVQIAHGIGEHIDRYDALAEFLTGNGFAAVGNDHLGHGKTPQTKDERYYFDKDGGWKYAAEDISNLQNILRKNFLEKPIFMLGHSMGSFLMRAFASMHPGRMNGLILSGTGNNPRPVTKAGISACNAMERLHGPLEHSKMLENMAFGSYTKKYKDKNTPLDWLSRDSEVVEKYIEDPMCGFDYPICLMKDLMDQVYYVTDVKNIRKMDKNVPVLLISGDMDPVGNYGKGVLSYSRVLKKQGIKNVECILYKDARHEIFNELCKEQVYADLIAWINKRIPATV